MSLCCCIFICEDRIAYELIYRALSGLAIQYVCMLINVARLVIFPSYEDTNARRCIDLLPRRQYALHRFERALRILLTGSQNLGPASPLHNRLFDKDFCYQVNLMGYKLVSGTVIFLTQIIGECSHCYSHLSESTFPSPILSLKTY